MNHYFSAHENILTPKSHNTSACRHVCPLPSHLKRSMYCNHHSVRINPSGCPPIRRSAAATLAESSITVRCRASSTLRSASFFIKYRTACTTTRPRIEKPVLPPSTWKPIFFPLPYPGPEKHALREKNASRCHCRPNFKLDKSKLWSPSGHESRLWSPRISVHAAVFEEPVLQTRERQVRHLPHHPHYLITPLITVLSGRPHLSRGVLRVLLKALLRV